MKPSATVDAWRGWTVARRSAYSLVAITVIALVVVGVLAVVSGREVVPGGVVTRSIVMGLLAVGLVVLVIGLSRWVASPVTTLPNEVRARARQRERTSVANVVEDVVCGTSSDIAEILNSIAQLHDDQTRRADELTTLVSAILHDQKATVSGLALLLDALARDEAIPPDAQGRVEASLRDLSLAISRSLDLLRVGAADTRISRRQCRVDDLVRRVVERIGPIAAHRGVHVEVSGEAKGDLDLALVSRALEAAITNAVSVARSTVLIDVLPGLLRIADDGPGLARPLEELVTVYVSRRDGDTGESLLSSSGLGMAIIHHSLEAHGGRLRVERTSPSGTVLLLYLGG